MVRLGIHSPSTVHHPIILRNTRSLTRVLTLWKTSFSFSYGDLWWLEESWRWWQTWSKRPRYPVFHHHIVFSLNEILPGGLASFVWTIILARSVPGRNSCIIPYIDLIRRIWQRRHHRTWKPCCCCCSAWFNMSEALDFTPSSTRPNTMGNNEWPAEKLQSAAVCTKPTPVTSQEATKKEIECIFILGP